MGKVIRMGGVGYWKRIGTSLRMNVRKCKEVVKAEKCAQGAKANQ
jgi:hypothetical protein